MMETAEDLLHDLRDAGEAITLDGAEVFVIWEQTRIEGVVAQYDRQITARSIDLSSMIATSVIVRGTEEFFPIMGSLDDDGQGITEFRVKRRA